MGQYFPIVDLILQPSHKGVVGITRQTPIEYWCFALSTEWSVELVNRLFKSITMMEPCVTLALTVNVINA